MTETDYRKDYIVTASTDIGEITEGFTKNDLMGYEGDTILAKIQCMYNVFNEGTPNIKQHRFVTLIVRVKRKVVFG